MKEVTSIKYECSDGTRYEDKTKAQKYEFKLVAESHLPDTDSRMTVLALIDQMFENPDPYINMLTEAKVDQLGQEAAE